MKSLILIPARGGSKGIPDKNIKKLNGKPLIEYTIDVAKQFGDVGEICVSTDDPKIKSMAENLGIEVPFIRPDTLATDTASTYDVILHAIGYYEKKGILFDNVVLLQPTSPFRKAIHLQNALDLYDPKMDMVASVTETTANPYYVLFEENGKGYLEQSKEGNFTRRQDCPKVYEMNGAIFIYNTNSLRKHHPGKFNRIKKYIMDRQSSLDIDTPFDWQIAECLIQNNYNDS